MQSGEGVRGRFRRVGHRSAYSADIEQVQFGRSDEIETASMTLANTLAERYASEHSIPVTYRGNMIYSPAFYCTESVPLTGLHFDLPTITSPSAVWLTTQI